MFSLIKLNFGWKQFEKIKWNQTSVHKHGIIGRHVPHNSSSLFFSKFSLKILMFIFLWKTCPQIRSSIIYNFQPTSHYIFVLISYNMDFFNIMKCFPEKVKKFFMIAGCLTFDNLTTTWQLYKLQLLEFVYFFGGLWYLIYYFEAKFQNFYFHHL